MEISHNLNVMLDIQNRLNQNAKDIVNASVATKIDVEASNLEEVAPDLTEALVEQIEIPIAYSAQGEVIKTKDDTTKTLLEIFA
jgi:flagellar hook protein FlgE